MAHSRPEQVLRDLMAGNVRFVEATDPECFASYQTEQKPRVTLLTCCDSRVHHGVFDRDPVGNFFVVRNIGNQMYDSRGSLDFGVRKLETPLLLVMGHSRCGAVKAAMADYSHEQSLAITQKLHGLQLPLREVKTAEEFETTWLRGVEANVDYQVTLARRRYKDLVEKGQLEVIGCVYDFANLYGRGFGQVILRPEAARFLGVEVIEG